MAFPERVKKEAKVKAHFACIICHKAFVEVHHIIPESENGPNTLDNAAPLCARCHDIYGGNPDKRKQLREIRDFRWEYCANDLQSQPEVELHKKLDDIALGQTQHAQMLKDIKDTLVSYHNQSTVCISSSETTSEVSIASGMQIGGRSGLHDRVKENEFNSCVVRQVANRGELVSALKLVHDMYVKRGSMKPQASGIHISHRYALPTTRTYIALRDGEVVSTISLFFDSPLGLSLDELYFDYLNGLRTEGRCLTEMGMVADSGKALLRNMPLFFRLLKLVFWDAGKESQDDMIIAVNPRHVRFYQRLLCFEQFATVKSSHSILGAPVVPMRVNLKSLTPKSFIPKIRKLFYGPLTPERLNTTTYRMKREDLEYFFVEKTDTFAQLTDLQRKTIEGHYPGLDISELENIGRRVS